MYLHLGQDQVVCTRDIIGIFDLENTSTAKHTRQYLAAVQKKGKVVSVSQELPKSFIICREKEGQRVYLSQISTATLKKRCFFLSEQP